jgi:hypothetical protein
MTTKDYSQGGFHYLIVSNGNQRSKHGKSRDKELSQNLGERPALAGWSEETGRSHRPFAGSVRVHTIAMPPSMTCLQIRSLTPILFFAKQ